MRAEFATISRSRNPRISRKRDVVRRWRMLSRGRRTYNFLASLSQNLRAAAINWIILRLARGFLNRVFLLFSLPTFFLPLLLFLFYRARLWKPRASGCVFFPPRDFFEREKARHFVRHFLPPPPPPFSSFFVAFLFKIYRGVRRANLIKKVSGRNCCLSRCCSHSRAIFFALRTFSSPPPPSTTNQQGWKISPVSDPRVSEGRWLANGEKVWNAPLVVVVVFNKKRSAINLDENKRE